jgi:hypothetical protein
MRLQCTELANSLRFRRVGTWNTGASEPFGAEAGHAPRALRESLFVHKEPCDVYFLGMQEGVSDAVFNASESLLGILGNCIRVPLHGPKAGTSAAAAAEENADGAERLRDRINGRGDGSLVSTKFTGAAVFVNKKLFGTGVRLLGCVAQAVEKLGSKGGVAVALKVMHSTICFVTCHLEAKHNEVRRAQYKELVSQLGSQLGENGFDLTAQFSHVVWTGDLNYRCVKTNGTPMPAEEVVVLLQNGENRTLFEHHDQLNQERRGGHVFYQFDEPIPCPDFFPTYKKFENRGSTDYTLDWVRQVYRIRYKEPMYKGGNVKERTPGYCDRILYRPMADHRDRGTLRPEVLDAEYEFMLVSARAI